MALARDEFDASVREVDRLIEVAESLDDDSPASVEFGNALLRSATVLLVSHFEAFLKSTAEEFVDQLGTGSLPAQKIPYGIRYEQTVVVLKAVLNSSSEAEARSHLKKLGAVAALWTEQSKPPRGTLDAQLIARVVTSAKPPVIDKLFELMGSTIPVCAGDIDVTAPEGDIASVNIALALTDIVTARDQIAHGAADRKPTSADVRRYRRILSALAQRLDRKARELIPD